MWKKDYCNVIIVTQNNVGSKVGHTMLSPTEQHLS